MSLILIVADSVREDVIGCRGARQWDHSGAPPPALPAERTASARPGRSEPCTKVDWASLGASETVRHSPWDCPASELPSSHA
jgi:hypothetical protein